MLRANPADDAESLLNNRVTDAIARHRKLLFVLIALLYIGGFNGKWRLGLDSANYRGLALNIAQGKGYTFGDWAPNQIYPGFPYILAGIERVLGPHDRTPSLAQQKRLLDASPATLASVLFVFLCAGATLILVYRLMRLDYPIWVATTVTCGVATNAVFLQHAHEILTDVPFLLGVVLSLYGWELLKRAQMTSTRARAAAVMVPGLILAASLRPTFWILAVCWAGACIWGLLTAKRRLFAICLVVLVVVWVSLHGFNPLKGGYEREAMDVIPDAPSHLRAQVHYILHDQLPTAMFGERLAPFSILGSLVLLGSTLLLLRRHAMWVMMVWVTFVVTTLLSAAPRYYMMVLPILMLSWLTMLCELARRLPRIWGEAALVVGLALVTLNNLSASIHFYIEQHRPHFIEHYKRGAYVPVLAMCEKIRQNVRTDQKVLGPSGSIMSIFTGVHVFTQREVLPRGDGPDSPAKIASAGFDYVVCPGWIYRDKEPVIGRLLDRRIVMPVKVIGPVLKPSGWYLAQVHVTVPKIDDWRDLPWDWKPPPVVEPPKPRPHPPATTRPVRRKRRRAAAATTEAAYVATQPATQPGLER